MRQPSNLHWFYFLLIIFLPSCFSSSKKVKEKKLNEQNSHSVFFPLSEEYIRNDVRNQYASKEGGCVSGHNKGIKKTRKQKRLALQESVRQQEARLADIPIPLNVEPISDFFENDASASSQHASLGYSAHMSPEQANDFFKSEMERHGWRCMSDVAGPEMLSHFVKPDKFCSISIRPQSGRRTGSDIIIFSGPFAPT